MLKVLFSTILLICMSFTPISAQNKSIFEKTTLSEHVIKISNSLSGYEIKVIASIGDDGILLVDTGSTETADLLKKELLTYGKGAPKIIINTHAHGEHFLGNIAFDKETLIIGHSKLKERMQNGYFLFEEFPDYMMPDLTIGEGEMTVYFNGETIKIIPLGGGHDETDIVVWFTGSKVACVAGLSGGDHFPSLDRTGDTVVYLERLKKLIDMLPDDTTIIASHGKDIKMTEYKKYYQTLFDVYTIVNEGVSTGKKTEEIVSDERLKTFASYGEGFTSLKGWVNFLVRDINIHLGNIPKPEKNYLYTPFYAAYKTNGIIGLVKKYQSLKKHYFTKDALFFEYALTQIGSIFWDKGKHDESAKICELLVKDFPKSYYAFLGYYYIGKNYQEKGDKKTALKNYKLALDLSPDNPDILAAIKEVE